MFLSVLLLAILAASSALLIRELARDSQSLAEEALLVSVVENANSASKHFGDLKYWAINSAVTQLARSQEEAAVAKERLNSELKAISAVDPAVVASIEGEVDRLTDLTRQAGAAYSSDDSAGGNALLEQAKSRILNIDDEISRDCRPDRAAGGGAARRLDAQGRAGGQARDCGGIGGAGARARLHRAHRTLHHRALETDGRSAWRRSRAATSTPPCRRPTFPEIEAMTGTLGMLRESLIERGRLERERQRAETEIRAARDAAEAALHELKAAQANLIQAEKMASLGQLTAGIAHEIKNPLNFVNNFANLSVELLDELKETTAPALATLDDRKRRSRRNVEMLTGNLEKIAEHGRRADGIVKSMLEHSRGGTGERRSIDLNGLIEEALNLAYHGARAQDQNFNVTLERDYARDIAPIELVPQDMTRVLLNLFSNGFYAANKRRTRTATEVQADAQGGDTRSRRRGRDPRPRQRRPAFQPRSGTSCSSRSSPPSRPAKAPVLASRSAMTS